MAYLGGCAIVFSSNLFICDLLFSSHSLKWMLCSSVAGDTGF